MGGTKSINSIKYKYKNLTGINKMQINPKKSQYIFIHKGYIFTLAKKS